MNRLDATATSHTYGFGLQTPETLEPPAVPDCFSLQSQAGAGGMGSVWRAEDLRTGQTVAIKVTRDKNGVDHALLRQEFRVASEVVHPSLAGVLELHADSGQPVLVMEWIDGVPLHQRRLGGIALRKALLAVTEGLLTLHSAGLVHRDIKGDNILLGNDGRVVVVDFGLASPVDHAHRSFAGTLSHMAPELLMGGPATVASDVYALGTELYRLLSGTLPVGGAPVTQAQAKTACWFQAPHDASPDCDRDLSALAMAMLAADPASRPSLSEIRRRLGGPGRLGQPWIERPGVASQLNAALSSDGSRRIWVHGASGVGKTSLVRRILRQRSDVTVLWGTFSPTEHLPLAGLQAIADQVRLISPACEDDRELRRQAGAVFPVLDEHAERYPGERLTPTRVREALEAFRTLLERLAQHRPIVAVLDDAQWMGPDARSAIEMLSLNRDADIGWIFVSRPNPPPANDDHVHIEVGEIPRRLIAERLGLPDPDSHQGSVPGYLVATLLKGTAPGFDAAASWRVELDRTADGLTRDQLRALDLLVLSPSPLTRSQLARCGVTLGSLRGLTATGLARQWVEQENQLIAPVHARVAEHLAERVAEPIEVHTAVGEVLAADGPRHAAHAAAHFRRAGKEKQAAGQLARAAEWAITEGRFHDALDHVDHGRRLGLVVGECARLAGRALDALGRPDEAIATYLSATNEVEDDAKINLLAQVADIRVGRGELEAGLQTLETILEPFHHNLPGGLFAALLEGVLAPAVGWQPSRSVRPGPRSDVELQALWTAARGISTLEPIQSLALHTRHETIARQVDSLVHRRRALSWRLWLARGERGESSEVDAEVNTLGVHEDTCPAEDRFTVEAAGALGYYLGARWSLAAEALDALRASPIASKARNWESRFVDVLHVQAHADNAHLDWTAIQVERIRRDCQVRDDRLGQASIDLVPGVLVELLRTGEVSAGQALRDRAEAAWGQQLLPDLEFRSWGADILLALARGDGDGALAQIDGLPFRIRSLRRMRLPRLVLDSLAARGLLLLRSSWRRNRRLRKLLGQLVEVACPWSRAMAQAHLACLATQEDRLDDARALRKEAAPVLRAEHHGFVATLLEGSDEEVRACGASNPQFARRLFLGSGAEVLHKL